MAPGGCARRGAAGMPQCRRADPGLPRLEPQPFLPVAVRFPEPTFLERSLPAPNRGRRHGRAKWACLNRILPTISTHPAHAVDCLCELVLKNEILPITPNTIVSMMPTIDNGIEREFSSRFLSNSSFLVLITPTSSLNFLLTAS